MTLILWDIDGTLVRSNGGRVAVSAFLRALGSASGLPQELLYPGDSGGKTDTQLAMEVLAAAQIVGADAGTVLNNFQRRRSCRRRGHRQI